MDLRFDSIPRCFYNSKYWFSYNDNYDIWQVKDLLPLCTQCLEEINQAVAANEDDDNLRRQFNRFKAACLTRRSWAYNQLGRSTEGAADANEAKVALRG